MRIDRLACVSVMIGMALLMGSCGPQTAPPAPTASPPTVAAAAPTNVPPTAPPLPSATPIPNATATPQPIADPQTGAPAFARGRIAARPYIVMIDNHPDAYPQTGLDHAAVVIEALAEYGVTRYMAIFVPGISPPAEKIGPVRSTRTYFVQWAMGFRALYAHAGGSPEGLQLAATTDKVINLDAIAESDSGAPYFYRSRDRDAPHNLYTTTGRMLKAIDELGGASFADANQNMGFLFKPDAPASERPDVQRISYFFLYKEAPVGWVYDPATDGYKRLWLNRPGVDGATGVQLWTKNVLFMEVHEQPIPDDDKARIEQDVIGEGPARVFLDGTAHDLTWRKTAADAPLRFYETDGSEVRLNVGPTWIAAVPSLDNITVK